MPIYSKIEVVNLEPKNYMCPVMSHIVLAYVVIAVQFGLKTKLIVVFFAEAWLFVLG